MSETGRLCSTPKEKLISFWETWKWQDKKMHQNVFITVPEAKIEQINFCIRLCENVLFYSSLQFVNLMLNQIIV